MTATLPIERRPVGRSELTVSRVALGSGDFGLSPERIVRQIELSLERLGIGSVDLYLAHEFDPNVPPFETLGVFEELLRAGTIRAYGVSNFDAVQLKAALAAGAPAAIQNEHSLLARGDDAAVLPLCEREQVAYVVFSVERC